MLKIGVNTFQVEKIYNTGHIKENFEEVDIKYSDIKEIVLWGSEAVDILVEENLEYGIILDNNDELQKMINFINTNKENLKNVEIKDREKIL